MDYILVLVGFVFLVFGANALVDGAVAFAKRFNISEMIIGLTIVAFGTSLPEFVVSLFATFEGSTDIQLPMLLEAIPLTPILF